MPCYTTGSEAGDARLGEREAHEQVTLLTRHLCTLCRRIDRDGVESVHTKETYRWWQQHQRVDKRKER